jgi:hypothetical protein
MTALRGCAVACALSVMLTAASGPRPLHAQAGAGSAAAAVLQIPAGGRVAGMGGAYAAAADADALFYNPASAAWAELSVGVALQRHVMDAGFSTAGAAMRLRFLSVALTFSVLDYGAVDELVPDPAFQGQRGIETGETVGASDVAGRMIVALPLHDGRLAVGASFGLLWSSLAESARTAELFDVGAQYRVTDAFSIGVALRNAGSALSGSRLADAELPTEVRAGAVWLPAMAPAGLLPALHLDVIAPLYEADAAVAAGIEVRTAPASLAGQPFTAALRAGFNGAPGAHAVGRFHYGAGMSVQRLGIDYTVQPMGELGVTHRVGLRWSR